MSMAKMPGWVGIKIDPDTASRDWVNGCINYNEAIRILVCTGSVICTHAICAVLCCCSIIYADCAGTTSYRFSLVSICQTYKRLTLGFKTDQTLPVPVGY